MRSLKNQLKLSEKEIEKNILSYLNLRSDVMVWKNETQGTFDRTKMVYRKNTSGYRRKGVADILGIVTTGNKKGKFIAIEVKSITGRLSPEQKKFLADISSSGGISFYARSIEEVQQTLDAELYPSFPINKTIDIFG